jgi:hypothetical protein
MKKHILLMNQTDGTNNGGGATPPAAQTPPPQATSKAQGSSDETVLESLYGKPPEKTEVQPPQEGTKNKAGKAGAAGYEEPPAGSASGYQEPKKVDPPAAPPETKVEVPPAAADDIKFDETGLSKEAIEQVKNFAKTNKLSKEATDAFAKYTKDQAKSLSEQQALQAQQIEQAKTQQRSDWYNQLKTDKDFGGELFNANLKRVDTILDKFFPNTKNLLTTHKSVLPPDIMKDLHSLHKVLLGSETMVNPGNQSQNTQDDDQSFLKNFYT